MRTVGDDGITGSDSSNSGRILSPNAECTMLIGYRRFATTHRDISGFANVRAELGAELIALTHFFLEPATIFERPSAPQAGIT